ncbi:MAG: alanine--tRNA ligase [Chloroflexi bacterium]|nr:alanine--tRNA ligase [Chloroflexota bacterium]
MPDFLTGDEIREKFLSYFEAQGHTRHASSSLIPVGDPTLLLTTAGMVQFKPYFTGEAEPSNRRATTSQKCFRTPDIEEVGDATHNTLFEMLGNFSFGDYFKSNAVDFAVELMTEGYGIPLDKFSAAIHNTDEETRGLWEAKGIPADKVYSYGDDENWWGPAGDEGPCGPCSELHYDYGAEFGCLQDDCAPNCTNVMADGVVCDRYVELWNLVFMQYYHHLDGTRTPLPAPSVDTGMGFERLVRILQDVNTAYETDLFTPIIAAVERVSGKSYDNPDDTYAIRVVAEHGRSVTFLIADGVVPGNEGRGYVLRRVIRRAIRYARRLGIEGNFLGEIADATIDRMGKVYPELVNNRDFILTVLRLEEERFQQAFQNGYNMLTEALEDVKTLDGSTMFRLWDTYGFPPEMTQEIAAEQGVSVDTEGFEREMEAQRQRGRASAQFGEELAKIQQYQSLGVGATQFLGYEQISASSPIVGLIADDVVVSEATAGQSIELVLVQTPFYPEGGGQIGDAGTLTAPDGTIEVQDTQAVMPDVIMHFGKVTDGVVRLGETVQAEVDPLRREDTARNHTATHMLHAALREVLGPHVRQAGSLVAPDRLRFDFSHVQPVTDDELWQVQHLVNEKIRQNASVHRDEDTYSSAIQRGALAFFGDRYGERVRLIEIANGDIFSFEVCGGTHVHHTGEVGSVYILGESSIGAGMRRLEAVSGRAAERLVWERFNREDALASTLNTTPPELTAAIQRIQDENDELRRQMQALERQNTLQAAEILLETRQDINGVSVLAARTEASNADAMREISDWLRDKMGSGIVVLGAVINDRPTISVGITRDLVDSGADAREYARDLGRIIGGGGGGRPDMAQAGGRNPDKLDAAIDGAADIVREKTA